jgi:adenylate kinase
MSSSRFFPKMDAVGVLPKPDRTAWLRGGGHSCLMPPRKPVGLARRIILLGAPGVGKRTQAEILCERLGTCHLATNDVFRTAQGCPESELSPATCNALDYLQRGEPVPDETVLNLVGERLGCLHCSGGFLLDGFPRTVAQAKALEQLLDSHHLRLTAVFNYELPGDEIVARISGRRTCADCNATFHLAMRPPRVAETCDHCGGRLGQPDDGRPEFVQARLEAHEKSVKPLIDFYLKRGLLVNISAAGTPEEVYQRTRLCALAR